MSICTIHLLEGDLSQMSTMDERLRRAGFTVGRRDVYPTIEESQYDAALRYLFEHRVEGWWNQETALIKRGILSQRDFDVALGRVPQTGRIVVVDGPFIPQADIGARSRVLTYNQARMLMSQGKITLISADDQKAVFALKPPSDWNDVNFACLRWPVHSAGEWDVAYGEGPWFAGEIAVYDETGKGEQKSIRPVAVTCLNVESEDQGSASVAHVCDNGDHPGIEECVANAELMRHAPRLLKTLAALVCNEKLRDLMERDEYVGLRAYLTEADATVDAVLDAMAGATPA